MQANGAFCRPHICTGDTFVKGTNSERGRVAKVREGTCCQMHKFMLQAIVFASLSFYHNHTKFAIQIDLSRPTTWFGTAESPAKFPLWTWQFWGRCTLLVLQYGSLQHIIVGRLPVLLQATLYPAVFIKSYSYYSPFQWYKEGIGINSSEIISYRNYSDK